MPRLAAVLFAVLMLAAIPAVASAAESPHGGYVPAPGLGKCGLCHRSHQASTQTGLLTFETTTAPITQTLFCQKCHGYAGPAASNVVESFAQTLPSGHRVEDATGTVPADLTNTCSSCHEPHSSDAGLPRSAINGREVTRTADPNSWCFACHDPDLDPNWSGLVGPAYYDQLLDLASRDASGYPLAGTFRGKSAYRTTSAHASIPASETAGRVEGDCLWCHASHRGPSTYDSLVATFGPSVPGNPGADLCLTCHDDDDGYGSGHLITSAGALLPEGSPLPCYECHNAHGSRNGNTVLISDALGSNLNPDSRSTTYTPESQAAFCFSCHLSSDGYWWDSAGASMEPAAAIASAPTTSVVGIDRLDLMLPMGVGAHESTGLTAGCGCHGTIHAPSAGGVSPGGIACYGCHGQYEEYMEDGGAKSTSVYHHVVGTGTGDGDTAFAPGSYPTSTTDVYCMSCHADHDQFNAQQAANLRRDLTSAATTATTDYLASGTYGICVSCHATSLAKDTVNRKNDGSTATPKIVGGAGAGGFGAGSHNYTVDSTFSDNSTFAANCSKCHTDEQAKGFQNHGGPRFGLHFSAVRRVLSALGGPVTDPLAENHCYRCHSRPGDLAGGKTLAESGSDWYGAASMSAASEDVFRQFQLAGSSHPVAGSPTGAVECESCHNTHVVNSGARVSNPYNTYGTVAYSTTDDQVTYCRNCHGGSAPGRVVDNATYVPYTVSLAAGGMNKFAFPDRAGRAHWSASGAISSAERQSCAVCHDNHGSEYPKLLGVRNVFTGTNRINSAAITGNDNSVCYACHTTASTGYPQFARLANGYPNTGTWPGSAVYTGTATGIHNKTGVVWPGSGYTGGDCKNCHDVHGTANEYDVLRGTYTQANFGTCFTCHNGTVAGAANIRQWYPVSAGGDAPDGTNRYGHKGTDGGAVADRPLACYNCHNPHGSYSRGQNRPNGDPTYPGLMVVTQTGPSTSPPVVFGDQANEINLSTVAGVRQYCFMCHLSGGNNVFFGWNGTAYADVPAGATVDGFDRRIDLKINNNGQAHRYNPNAANNLSCLQAGCHGAGNVHYPVTP